MTPTVLGVPNASASPWAPGPKCKGRPQRTCATRRKVPRSCPRNKGWGGGCRDMPACEARHEHTHAFSRHRGLFLPSGRSADEPPLEAFGQAARPSVIIGGVTIAGSWCYQCRNSHTPGRKLVSECHLILLVLADGLQQLCLCRFRAAACNCLGANLGARLPIYTSAPELGAPPWRHSGRHVLGARPSSRGASLVWTARTMLAATVDTSTSIVATIGAARSLLAAHMWAIFEVFLCCQALGNPGVM